WCPLRRPRGPCPRSRAPSVRCPAARAAHRARCRHRAGPRRRGRAAPARCRRRRGRGPSGRRRAGRADGSGAPCEPTGPDLGHTGGMARTPDRAEAALLPSMLPHLPHGPEVEVGPGDDAAVVRLPSPRLVVTTDTLVEGHDFLGHATTARWIGRKAAVQNLADVAAMGAAPRALVVAI